MSHQTIESESVGKLSLQFLFSAKNKINAEIKIKKNAAETIACETTPLGNTSLYSTGIQTQKKSKLVPTFHRLLRIIFISSSSSWEYIINCNEVDSYQMLVLRQFSKQIPLVSRIFFSEREMILY